MNLKERQKKDLSLVGTEGDEMICDKCHLCLFEFTEDFHFIENENKHAIVPTKSEVLGLKFTATSSCPHCRSQLVFWPKNIITAEEREAARVGWANLRGIAAGKIKRGVPLEPGEHFYL